MRDSDFFSGREQPIKILNKYCNIKKMRKKAVFNVTDIQKIETKYKGE